MNDHKVSIVIPTYNKWHLTDQLLHGLSKHESENIDNILIVNNGSYEPWGGNKTDLEVIGVLDIPENVGFTKASNLGLQHVTGEVGEKHLVFLISNDVKISGKFIYQAEDILFGARRHFVGNRHIVFNSGWNTFGGVTFDYLEGWFLACTADGWRDLGYFDEAYSPYDYEDIDISTVAKNRGYRLTSLNNPHVTHLGGGTIGFNPAREAITKRNQEYFRKKWLGE